MSEIRVWSPDAESMAAVTWSERVPLTRDGETWVGELPPDTDYFLVRDGGAMLPDPRSAYQPSGVHGPSRTFDAAAFEWTDGGWRGRDVRDAVTYELHIGTFTTGGTLDSAIERLDHLADLGVDLVELMPVAAFPGRRGWGYDGVALYAVQESYGGPRALQRFVDAAHARGLAVCLDVVYNHLGPSGNYLAAFAPYFTERHQTPWGPGLDVDGAPAAHVRAFIVDNAVRWVRDFHIDALRLDAVHEIADTSERHILAELADAVHEAGAALGRTVGLVAESDLNDATMVTPTGEGGHGMDGQWADDVHHALHAYLTGETFGYYVDFGSAETLAAALTRVFVHDGGYSTFRGKDWGAPVPGGMDRRRFTVFTENHDQIGNRALGDPPEAVLPAGTIAAGAALLLLAPFTPMLFMGQEWGSRTPFQFFTDHDDDLGPLVTRGRLAEFADHGWEDLYGGTPDVPDPQDPATFARSILNWRDVDDEEHARMLDWHKRLIALRRETFGDGSGSQDVAVDYGESWLRMRRGRLSVIVAPGPSPARVADAAGSVACAWGTVTRSGAEIGLAGHSVVVLLAEDDADGGTGAE